MDISSEAKNIFTSRFLAIFSISLFIMMSYYLLFVIMGPFALKQFGASASMSGLVASIMILGCLVGRFVTGGTIHRIGFKKVLYAGIIIYCVSVALYLVTDSMFLLLVNRFIGGIGVGCIGTMTGTSVAYIVSSEQRGLGISFFSLSSIIALAAGPFLGITLMQYISFHAIFLICLGFGLVSLFIATILTIDFTPTSDETLPNTPCTLTDYIEYRAIPLGIVVMVTGVCYATVQSFLSFYAQEMNLMTAASMFYLIYSFVVFITRPASGKVFDMKGENIIMYPAILLMGIGLFLLCKADSLWLMLLAGGVFGAGFGNFQSVAQATSLKLVPSTRFSQATSTYYMLLDLGIGVGPYILGLLVPHIGYQGLYLVTSGLAFLCLPLYFFLHGKTAQQPS